MGKNSSRETISVKVSPGQNFLFLSIWCDVPGWHSAFCRVPSLHLVVECHPSPSDSLWNFTPECVKFLPGIFYPFWASHSQKLQIGLFDRRANKWCFLLARDKNLGSVILRWDQESNFRNFDLERLRTFRQRFRKFPSWIFYPFLTPHGWKL